MTTSRIGAVAIALSIAVGFVVGTGSTQGSAKEQNLSGTIASSKGVAIAPLMDSTTGWRHTESTGRHPKTIRSPHRFITSAKAVKRSIVGPRARSRWQFRCVASGSDRSNSGPQIQS